MASMRGSPLSLHEMKHLLPSIRVFRWRQARRDQGLARLPPHRLLLALLMLVTTSISANGLQIELDRDRIEQNETLRLRLVAAGRQIGTPDLQPLAADFEILKRDTSSRMSIVNGVMSHTTEWTLELLPKRAGQLAIPPLIWGDLSSVPLVVEVLAEQSRAPTAAPPRPIFVEASADQDAPYVEQPFRYRVKVIYRQMPLRALLSEPQVEGATLERESTDQGYSELIAGQRYQVVERRFLVIPEISGPLVIRGPRLEAVLPDQRVGGGGRREPPDDLLGGGSLGNPPAGRRVVARAPDLEIQVRPRPADSALPWLPAEAVQLTEAWSPSTPAMRVGEAVSRSLTLTVRGLTAAQLPPFDLGQPNGAEIFPEQSRTEDLPGEDTPAAIQRLDLVVVPTRDGNLTLPEISVPWWDTTTDQQRVALIPASTFSVAAVAPGSGAPVGQLAERTTPSDHSSDPSSDLGQAEPQPVALAASQGSRFWPWLAALLGLGWLLTLIQMKRRDRHARRARADHRCRLG